MAEESSVTNFREYLRIKTVHPTPDYETCTAFLRRQADELGAEIFVTECAPGKPTVIITLRGRDPSLPSILLNSHTDVVPVSAKHWKFDPFIAHKDEDGKIYGRGTQDMKSVGIQYIEALKELRKQGHMFLRNIHLSFVPDEEVASGAGMESFVQTDEFKALNVGFALDEGYANPTENYLVFYAERSIWWLEVICSGQPGHASQFLPNNASEKLRKVMTAFLNFRDEEEKRLKEKPGLHLGDVTTCNLTSVKGGDSYNVVPSEMKASFDIRIPPSRNFEEFEEQIAQWCRDAGEGVEYKFVWKDEKKTVTCVTEGESEWWEAFRDACQEEGVSLEKEVFPAGTDGAILRELGIPVLGFSPMNHTPLLLHDHNEYLEEKIFLRGIQIYCTILKRIANLKS